MPVPALTTVCARSRDVRRTHLSTAAAIGGEAIPVLDPATSTPAASTGAVGETATMVMPIVATTPALTATRRAPRRSVSTMLSTIATQYPT